MKLHDARETFESVASESIFEADYERCILRNARAIFPDSILLPFKIDVPSEEGTAQPDMVMLDRRLRRAWIVEAELSHHALAGHVEPQIRRLVFGRYGMSHVQHILTQDESLSRTALERLFCGPLQPSVLMIVDRLMPAWKTVLTPLGVTIGVVELFRSATNREILRVNGDIPTVPGELVAECVRNWLVPKWLTLQSADEAIFGSGRRVTISIDGGASRWICRHVGRDLVLMPEDRCPLPASYRTVRILFDERNGLSAQVN